MMYKDDVIAMLCEGAREAGEEIDLTHLSYEDDPNGSIHYEGPLPDALRPGVVVAKFKPETSIFDTGRQLGESVRLLRLNAEELAVSLTKGLDLAKRMAQTEPVTIVIAHERRPGGDYRIMAVIEVPTLDDALNPSSTLAVVEKDGFDDDMHTMRTLRGQRKRRSVLSRGLVIEQALVRAAGDALGPLVAHLRRMPSDPHVQAWGSGAWTAKRLAQYGIAMPMRIETVRVKDGRIFGRIRLSEATTWTDGTLIHRDSTIPVTTMQALVGGPLAALIVDDVLPSNAIISEVCVDGHGQVRAKTKPIDDPVPA